MTATAEKIEEATATLIKKDATKPCLKVLDRAAIVIRAGTAFNGASFETDTPVIIDVPLEPGTDYGVIVTAAGVGYAKLQSGAIAADVIGGFHFAPGGNASARVGGDDIPAINPCSLWDLNFRPACPDPRGMTLVEREGRRFWCDIYLTAASHADGTSRHGVTIADGDDVPDGKWPDGKKYTAFDYPTACAVLGVHGKGLLSIEEFFAAAFGVTEKTAASKNPKKTGLDAPRTSQRGLMQATGNMWVWGHDGDPDMPRASIFGGSWIDGGYAGSRCAVVDNWPGHSDGLLGARGRSDHLQLG